MLSSTFPPDIINFAFSFGTSTGGFSSLSCGWCEVSRSSLASPSGAALISSLNAVWLLATSGSVLFSSYGVSISTPESGVGLCSAGTSWGSLECIFFSVSASVTSGCSCRLNEMKDTSVNFLSLVAELLVILKDICSFWKWLFTHAAMNSSASCVIFTKLVPFNTRDARFGSFLVLNISVSWRISSLFRAVDISQKTFKLSNLFLVLNLARHPVSLLNERFKCSRWISWFICLQIFWANSNDMDVFINSRLVKEVLLLRNRDETLLRLLWQKSRCLRCSKFSICWQIFWHKSGFSDVPFSSKCCRYFLLLMIRLLRGFKLMDWMLNSFMKLLSETRSISWFSMFAGSEELSRMQEVALGLKASPPDPSTVPHWTPVNHRSVTSWYWLIS